MDEFGKENSKQKKDDIFKLFIDDENALGVTTPVMSILDGKVKGLFSIVGTTDEKYLVRTYVHEIGHLLGLSDVVDPKKDFYEGNLMHESAQSSQDFMLRYEGVLSKDYANKKEEQWDCLHYGGDACITPEWHEFMGDL